MCGIAGILFFDGPRHGLADKIQSMTALIRHRGPDDEGYCLIDTRANTYRLAAGDASIAPIRQEMPLLDELKGENYDLALGHRRFAVIDLGIGGHQPFFDRDRKICGIFDGLIYNYREIKVELEARGILFHSQSDTEVLFKAYDYWGDKCFEKLNGNWAVAIYDFERRELLLCRDRLGKKPIYIYRDQSRLYFASEIKAILKMLDRTVGANDRAVFDYIVAGYNDLHHSTFYEGIESIPCGTMLKIKAHGAVTSSKFWELLSHPNDLLKTPTPSAVAAELRNLVEDAVKIRLRADVGIGIQLRGGLDSVCIAAITNSNNGRLLSCYNVEFPHAQWHETPLAAEAAACFQTDHKIIRSPDRCFWRDVENFVALHEEPVHSPILHTQQTVWRHMREVGIRVILHGGGELLTGYRKEYFYRYLLRSGEKSAMAVPMEARAPLLDYRLVEFAFQLPVELLIRNGWLKWTLRKAVEDLLPPKITWRSHKLQQSFPLQQWLEDSVAIAKAIIARSDNPYINKGLIAENLERWISHQPDLVWRILNLELWHKHFIRGERILDEQAAKSL
jgi:asparagine synthase (glutamine-hydrolysing)